MPYNQRQLNRVLDSDLIPASRVPHLATRAAESEIKRRVFALEDGAVVTLFDLYARFYRGIRQQAHDLADEHGISTVQPDRRGDAWRKTLLRRIEQGIPALTDDVAASALRATASAYYAGYYSRLWLLDMATNADVRIPATPPPLDDLFRKVVQPLLREDVYDDIIRSNLGAEWRALYATELDDLVLRIRRTLAAGMSEGLGVDDLMRRVRDTMGISTDRRRGFRQNFHRVQTITRTFVNQASNDGAVAAYRQNRDVLAGYQWLTAKDERVCPQCRGLDGTQYAMGDSYRPPAHPNCRCTVVPIIRSELLVADDERPRETLSAWANARGVDVLLGAFLGARLASSRF